MKIFLFTIVATLFFSGLTYSLSITNYCDSLLAGRSGCIVVADLRTGELMAEVGDSGSLNGCHPPGSLFKIVSALAAVNEGIAEWDYSSDCDYDFEFKEKRYKCSLAGGHGTLDLEGAIKQSCNHYFYNLVLLGLNCDMLSKHAEYLHLTELSPFGKRHDCAILPDEKIDPFEAVIGQPPIAISVYHALTLDFIIALNGENIPSKIFTNKTKKFALHYKKRDLERVRNALIKSDGELNYGGKTGTPRSEDGTGTRAWFLGWAPFEKPIYAIVVFLQKGYGQRDAEPIARKALLELLKNNN